MYKITGERLSVSYKRVISLISHDIKFWVSVIKGLGVLVLGEKEGMENKECIL